MLMFRTDFESDRQAQVILPVLQTFSDELKNSITQANQSLQVIT